MNIAELIAAADSIDKDKFAQNFEERLRKRELEWEQEAQRQRNAMPEFLRRTYTL